MSEEKKSGGDPGYIKTDRRVSRQTETPKADPSEEKPGTESEPQPDSTAAETEASQASAPKPEAQASSAEASSEPSTSSDHSESQPQTLADVGVYGVLRFCVSLLMEQAWVALGIRALPGRETQENLPEAKVAIDALASLVGHLQPDLDPSEKQELEAGLANLRINFVRRAG